jgi:hypothetical protein
VNKFLDGIEEEEDYRGGHGTTSRKRTRSSNFLGRVPHLPEIDEEEQEAYEIMIEQR